MIRNHQLKDVIPYDLIGEPLVPGMRVSLLITDFIDGTMKSVGCGMLVSIVGKEAMVLWSQPPELDLAGKSLRELNKQVLKALDEAIKLYF